MFRSFIVGFFQKVYKSCLLLLVAFPGLIDIFCTVASWKVLSMIVPDVETKVLDIEIFRQYTIADLNSGITFIGEAFTVKGKNTQTHT